MTGNREAGSFTRSLQWVWWHPLRPSYPVRSVPIIPDWTSFKPMMLKGNKLCLAQGSDFNPSFNVGEKQNHLEGQIFIWPQLRGPRLCDVVHREGQRMVENLSGITEWGRDVCHDPSRGMGKQCRGMKMENVMAESLWSWRWRKKKDLVLAFTQICN